MSTQNLTSGVNHGAYSFVHLWYSNTGTPPTSIYHFAKRNSQVHPLPLGWCFQEPCVAYEKIHNILPKLCLKSAKLDSKERILICAIFRYILKTKLKKIITFLDNIVNYIWPVFIFSYFSLPNNFFNPTAFLINLILKLTKNKHLLRYNERFCGFSY